jgi:hypothetical protein
VYEILSHIFLDRIGFTRFFRIDRISSCES